VAAVAALIAALTLTIVQDLLKRINNLLKSAVAAAAAAAALRALALLAQNGTDCTNHACHVSSPLEINIRFLSRRDNRRSALQVNKKRNCINGLIHNFR
jgi:hypothetical protein